MSDAIMAVFESDRTVSEGKDLRLAKWQRKLNYARPGSQEYRTADAMVKRFRADLASKSVAEQGRGGLTVAELQSRIIAVLVERELRTTVPGNGFSFLEWVNDLTNEYRNLNFRISVNNTEIQVRVRYPVKETLAAITGIQFKTVGDDCWYPIYQNVGQICKQAKQKVSHYPHKDHIHYHTLTAKYNRLVKEANAMSTIDANPDDMEKAALRLATLAQEIRDWDDKEPEGIEPVISWENQYEGQVYSFVAFKANAKRPNSPQSGADKWFVTGPRFGGRSYDWREFLDLDFTKGMRDNGFHVVSEWAFVEGSKPSTEES
jgi:hypothetical protein